MSLLSPQLQAFIEVAHKRSVHQAAEGLFITQTAVTQRIRQLEHKLNTSLFTRSRRGMLLTTEGEALLRYCLACLELEDETLDSLKTGGAHATIQMRITGPSSLMSSRIIPKCAKVMQNYPMLLMHFDISDRSDTLQKLREGISQFAILPTEQITNEMESKVLLPEEYVLVCSSKWQNRSLDDILTNERIIDFDPDDQLTFNYLQHYGLLNRVKRQRHFVNRTESIANLISAGHGYSVLAKEFCQPYITTQQLICLNNGEVYQQDVYLVWYPRPLLPQYFQAIVDCIK